MIELKNVSKFYYSKGVIATGFTKVSLSFDVGEFVAITGESGSGKSTLLNVISGLDTYEEGEMYINGEETSHYTTKDFEDYRRKYIGMIFQNFNLVNSYTVYENIELVLLMNGISKKEARDKVNALIEKVNLTAFRNTKVSKLSGGQKQRVAIARALAKETPIIIADEPTGNLDSKAAQEIIELLSSIAKDKLVIIVTHNYEQVEPYITRKITMHDGLILEDKKLRQIQAVEEQEIPEYKQIGLFNQIRLGIRNTFNIVPKFLLLLVVFLFVIVALMSEYGVFKRQEYQTSISGYNYIFNNTDPLRIILKKEDLTAFTDDDYETILSTNHVSSLEEYDILTDTYFTFTDIDEEIWLGGYVSSIESLDEEVDVGRLPENDNEVVVEGYVNDYYITKLANALLSGEALPSLYKMDDIVWQLNESISYQVVGIHYKEYDDWQTKIYVSEAALSSIMTDYYRKISSSSLTFMNQEYDVSFLFEGASIDYIDYLNQDVIYPTDLVPSGQAYVSNDFNTLTTDNKAVGKTIQLAVNSLFQYNEIDLTITEVYTKTNRLNLFSEEQYSFVNGTIFINTADYEQLFNIGNYQSSVYIDQLDNLSTLKEELNELGYTTLAIKDTLVNYETGSLINILRTVVTVILVITLFFIAYTVIRIILKSRNVYYSTIRMLGASKKVSRHLLMIELFIVANIAYLCFMIALYLEGQGVFYLSFMETVIMYLKPVDYIILYFIPIVMSYLIARRYARKLFVDSAMTTIKEEV